MSKTAAVLALSLMLLAFPAFADEATLQVEDVMGANPKLVDPVKSTFPTVKIAEVKRWEQARRRWPHPGLR